MTRGSCRFADLETVALRVNGSLCGAWAAVRPLQVLNHYVLQVLVMLRCSSMVAQQLSAPPPTLP